MTLADIASFICTKLTQTEPEDLAACKSFVRRRFEMIWADQLWKDSLFEYTQTLSSSGYSILSTWLPAKKVLLLPPAIDLVVAVRTDARRLDVESSERLYRVDFDTFAGTGSVAQYRLLAPAVWEFDANMAQDLYLNALAAADAGAAASVMLLGSDGVTLTRYRPALAVASVLVGTGSRVDSFSRLPGNGVLQLGPQLALPTTFTVVMNGPFTLGLGVNSNIEPGQVQLTQGQTTTLQVNVGDTIYFFFDGIYLGTSYVVVSALGTLTVTDVVSNWVFDNGIHLNSVLSLLATDTTAARRQRIQLFGTVPEGAVVRVLGKAKPPALTDDGDEPALTGCENILLAFGQADMLQRQRQYGKAQAVGQEAVALLEQLKRVQVVQQSNHKRFIPQDGYGPDYDLGLSPLIF